MQGHALAARTMPVHAQGTAAYVHVWDRDGKAGRLVTGCVPYVLQAGCATDACPRADLCLGFWPLAGCAVRCGAALLQGQNTDLDHVVVVALAEDTPQEDRLVEGR